MSNVLKVIDVTTHIVSISLRTMMFAPTLYTKSKPALYFCLQYICNLYNSLPPLSLALGRSLGRLERIENTYHSKAGTHIVSTVAFVGTSTAVTLDRLQQSLAYVANSYPLLRAKIVHENGTACWREMKNAPIRLRVDNSRDWKSALEQDCNEKFDTNRGPLWRVTYLPNASSDYDDVTYKHNIALVFSFHPSIVSHPRDVITKVINKVLHALTNEHNTGAGGFIRTVAKYTIDQSQALYNRFTDTVSYTSTSLKYVTETQQLLPDQMPVPFESFIRPNIICQALAECTNIGIVKSAINFWSNFLNYPLRNEFVDRIGLVQNIDPDVERKTSLLTVKFSEYETETLKQACRDNDVTIDSVIYAAATLAMTELLQGTIKPSMWDVVWPADVLKHGRVQMRHSLFETRAEDDDTSTSYEFDDFVNYCYVTDRPFPFKEATNNQHLWKLAKSYCANTKYNASSNVLLSYMSDALSHQLKTKADLDRQSAYNAGRTSTLLSFTSNGSHVMSSHGSKTSARVNAIYCMTNEHHIGPILSHGVSVVNNCLCLSVTYYTNVTTKSLTDKYVSKLKQFLLWIYESRK